MYTAESVFEIVLGLLERAKELNCSLDDVIEGVIKAKNEVLKHEEIQPI